MSRSRDNVVILGVYGKGNFGDEALLETVVTDIRSLWPNCRVQVFCSGPASVIARFGFEADTRTPKTGFFQKLNIIRKSRMVVVGGGTLLCDHGSPMADTVAVITYYFWLWLARLFGIPCVVYGQGFGPAGSVVIRLGLCLLGLSTSAVTVRDSRSFQLLLGHAGKWPHFRLAADPVAVSDRFCPSGVVPGVDASLKARIAALKPFVLIAVRYPKFGSIQNSRAYFDALGATVAHLGALAGTHVVLFPTHLSDEFQDDRAAMDDIESMLVRDGISKNKLVRAAWSSLDDAAHWLQAAEFVMGDRMHALLVAALAEVPIVGIAIEDKIPGCIQDIFGQSQAALCVDPCLVGASQTFAAIEDLWKRRESVKPEYRRLMARYRNRGQNNIKVVREVLEVSR